MEKSNKNSIFAALESATLPIEQRTRAELFVYMRMEYINPPLGTATLLAKPLIHEMSYVLSPRTYCHNIQKSTRMPWDFLSIGKMSHCGDSSLVFGLTHFSYTTKNHLAELCEIPLTFLPYCVKENNSSFCGS